jgi:hypothetical protein
MFRHGLNLEHFENLESLVFFKHFENWHVLFLALRAFSIGLGINALDSCLSWFIAFNTLRIRNSRAKKYTKQLSVLTQNLIYLPPSSDWKSSA